MSDDPDFPGLDEALANLKPVEPAVNLPELFFIPMPLAGQRIQKLADMADFLAQMTCCQLRDLIREANAARRNGEPEYRSYIRACRQSLDGNIITLF